MNTGIMHLDWLESVLNTELPSPAKMLAMYLSTYMNKDRIRAWPSISTMIKQTSLGKTTICKYIKLLEQQGWINRRKGNYHHSTIYQIQYPDSQIGNKSGSNITDISSSRHELGSAAGELMMFATRTKVVRHTNTNQQYNQQMNQQLLFEEENISSDIPKKKNITTTKFKKPTLEEVTEYCQQRHNDIDPNQFCDFYEMKDWMVGKVRMKNWQAAIRTWERNQKPKVDSFADYQ